MLKKVILFTNLKKLLDEAGEYAQIIGKLTLSINESLKTRTFKVIDLINTYSSSERKQIGGFAAHGRGYAFYSNEKYDVLEDLLKDLKAELLILDSTTRPKYIKIAQGNPEIGKVILEKSNASLYATLSDEIPLMWKLKDFPEESWKKLKDEGFEKIVAINDLDDKFLVLKSKKWGVVDMDAKEIIVPNFDHIEIFENERYRDSHFRTPGMKPVIEYFRVKKGKFSGLYDITGRRILYPKFDDFFEYSPGLYKVEKNEKYGLIQNSGKVVLKPQPINFESFEEGYIKFEENDRYGFADKSGNVLIPAQYEKASDFKGNFAWVKVKGKEAIIDRSGNFIRKPKSVINGSGDFLKTFNEFFKNLRIQEKGKQWIIPRNKRFNRDEYEVRDFDYVSEELLAFKSKGKWGLIHKEGKIVLTPDFDGIGYYEDIERWSSETRTKKYLPGLIRVKKDKKYGYVTREGELVYPIIFDSLEQGQRCRSGKLGGEYFIFDEAGKCIYPYEKDGISLERIIEDYLNKKGK